jgi:diguanylate cyclase (GGDEF)-like protein
MKNADEPIILIVDDNLENLFILQNDLQNMGYTVKQTQFPDQAMLLTKQFQFSLIILDVEMPVVNGFELFGKIREVPNNRDIPVLFLSANRIQRNDVIEGLKKGAFDYIVKPYDCEELNCRINLLVELFKKSKELHTKNHQLLELSIKDPLTNIYNRRFGMEVLQNEMHRHARYGGFLSLLLVDLDDFKNINDKFGHNAGDEVLNYVSHHLVKSIRDTDTCFRSGGDEFIVVLPSADMIACEFICKRIFNNLQSIHLKDGNEISIGLSIGGAVFETAQTDIIHLTETADIAMVNAKSSGKNRFKIVSEDSVLDNAQKSVMNISQVRSSIKMVLTNVLYEILNEFEITDNVINGHTELMIEILIKICPLLKLRKYDETLLINAVKLRRFEHLAVSKELLNKTEPLSLDQKAVLAEALIENMQKLKKISFFDDEIEILINHHEYCNGSGYPYAKDKNSIPYFSRLLAVVEAFVLLSLGGPHTDSYGFKSALEVLKQDAGSHFDSEIVLFFEDCITKNYLSDLQISNSANILVIDDQLEITNAIKRYLVFYGFANVISSNNKEEALSQIKTINFDLIITDISLPGTTKLSFLDDLREINKKVNLIIVSSGYAALAWQQKEKYNIFHSYRKPVNLHTLYTSVKEALISQKGASNEY